MPYGALRVGAVEPRYGFAGKERDAEGDRHGGKDLVEEILHILWVENVGSFPDSSHGRRGEIGATAVGCGGRFERMDPEQSAK